MSLLILWETDDVFIHFWCRFSRFSDWIMMMMMIDQMHWSSGLMLEVKLSWFVLDISIFQRSPLQSDSIALASRPVLVGMVRMEWLGDRELGEWQAQPGSADRSRDGQRGSIEHRKRWHIFNTEYLNVQFRSVGWFSWYSMSYSMNAHLDGLSSEQFTPLPP